MNYWEDFSVAPDGLYVCYVNSEFTSRFADRALLMLINGKWSYRGSSELYRDHVYGAYGPLPTMELE